MIGLIGLHSSIAILPDGSAWVAGYSAGTSYNRTYGDLAVAHVETNTTRDRRVVEPDRRRAGCGTDRRPGRLARRDLRGR